MFTVLESNMIPKVAIVESGKSLTVDDGKAECTMVFPSVKMREYAAEFLREYRANMTHVRGGECQKRIGQVLACFKGTEVK